MISLLGYAELLDELLARGPTADADDFVSLAVTGETLRRAVAAWDDAVPGAVRASLDAYSAALPSWRSSVPDDLAAELDDALGDLESLAAAGGEADGSTLIGRVDELIQVAVAGVHAGALDTTVPADLGRRAAEVAAAVAPRVPQLWQAAEDRAAWLADSGHSEAYGWIEALAALSPTRRALADPPPLDADDKRSILEGFLRRRAVAEQRVATGSSAEAWAIPAVSAWADELAGHLAQIEAREAVAAASPPRVVAMAEGSSDVARVGRVRVPVVVPGGGRAELVTLAIRSADGAVDSWAQAPELRSVARAALRDAFLCAARMMPGSLPPRPFDQHVFELESSAGVDAIDGPSLGLPAVAAFLSLWSDHALPERFVATGRVEMPKQSAEDAVREVGGIRLKLVAARSAGARLILPAANATGIDASDGLGLVELRQIIDIAKLTLPAEADYEPWLGDRGERIRLLEKMGDDVRAQRLDDYRRQGDDPWAVLAERMMAVLSSLEAGGSTDARAGQACAKGRAYAALAATHAADPATARRLLGEEPGAGVPPDVRLLSAIVRLSSSIKPGEVGDEAAFTELEARLAEADAAERELLGGQALGTLGRHRMHQRRLDEALPLLTRAIAHHDAHEPSESARSRIYLAMAQRMSDDVDAALATLVEAKDHLAANEASNRAQAALTRIYLEYELARCLLAADLPAAAATAARHADQAARAAALLWPRPGILRVLAWAQRARGKSVDAVLEELERVAGANDLFASFPREARGEPSDAREVY